MENVLKITRIVTKKNTFICLWTNDNIGNHYHINIFCSIAPNAVHPRAFKYNFSVLKNSYWVDFVNNMENNIFRTVEFYRN